MPIPATYQPNTPVIVYVDDIPGDLKIPEVRERLMRARGLAERKIDWAGTEVQFEAQSPGARALREKHGGDHVSWADIGA